MGKFSDYSNRISKKYSAYQSYMKMLLVKIVALSSIFIMQVVFARVLTVGQFGQYGLILSAITVTSVFCIWGGDRIIVKKVSLLASVNALREIDALAGTYGKIVLINCVVCTPVLYIYFDSSLALHSNSEFVLYLFLFLFLSTIIKVSTAVSKGLSKVVESEALLMMLRPIVVILLTLIASSVITVNISTVLTIIIVSYCIVYVINQYRNRLALQANSDSGSGSLFPLSSTYRQSFPFVLVGVGFPLLLNIDILILARYESVEVVAVYVVCSKLVGAVLMGLTSANLMISPKIAPLFRESKLNELAELIQVNNYFIFFITLAPVSILILFGMEVLSMYGSAYTSGYLVLMYLLVSQLINVISGPVNLVSTMIGHQKAAAYIVLTACMVELLLSIVLIPGRGMYGAALANITAIAIANFGIALFLYRKTGINVTLFGNSRVSRGK